LRDDPEQIVRRYGDMVLRIAMANTGNRADAEDVFQEVFIRLIRSLAKIENEEHLRYWLVRATVNRCKSLFASANKQREYPTEILPEPASDISEQQLHTPAIDALQTLPEKYRTPIHLFYIEDLPIANIAQILNCSVGTIKSQLSRGRKMLKLAVEKDLDV
jgi:RNA polymerase sigma-70 factor (ECF subfamily)